MAQIATSLRHTIGAQKRRAQKKWLFIRDGFFGPLPAPEKWVFVVGCYNSGTTLLHDLLARHPAVGSMPKEGQFYTDELLLPMSVGLPRLWSLEPERFRLNESSGSGVNVARLKRQWGAHYNDPTRPILLEKSPTNAARTRWLQAHFANAHFIGIIRDGRAVAEGIRRKVGHSLEIAATQWVRSNEIMLEDFTALEHSMLIRYETFTDRPDQMFTDILDFLGLAKALPSVEGREWRVHEQVSVIRNMNDRSMSRLTSQDLSVIDGIAGGLLRRLGYTH